ncbi:hypothetical protein PInf_008957 [Phytophthora infestans]|nr:hypothetical protein PInf_008957 [Phytophthora infestans]
MPSKTSPYQSPYQNRFDLSYDHFPVKTRWHPAAHVEVKASGIDVLLPLKMQQPNYPPRGYGGQAPPQQQQAPRSAADTRLLMLEVYLPAGFPGVQQPQAPHSGIGGRPGFPGHVQQVPTPGSQGSFRPGQQFGGPPAPGSQGSFRLASSLARLASRSPSDGANSGGTTGEPRATWCCRTQCLPGQGPPAPGSFQNAPPAAGPGSSSQGHLARKGTETAVPAGPPGPGQQFNNALPQHGGRPGPRPPQLGGQMQGPPPPQFNGQQGPPQGGAAPYLQPNRNAGPYPGPPGPGGAAPYGAPGAPGAPGAYGQPQQGGYPQQQQPQATQAPKQRIDPTQIPRPVVSAERVQYVARGHTVTMPPAASSDYVCVDEGCCNPRFIRPTLNHVPANKDLLKQCGLPLAAVICPLADLQEDELPIPLVDFGPSGPLRCTRCAAYVNSFTKFIQGGRKFVCNICQLNNETPRDYYCSVDQYGKRRDIQERAELSRGSVEYVVPAAYTIRPPQEPILVFVLDVSLFPSRLGSLLVPCSRFSICCRRWPEQAQEIGIVTFDTAVHYYRMDNGSSSISMSICPELISRGSYSLVAGWSPWRTQLRQKRSQSYRKSSRAVENTTKNQAVSGAALWSVADALAVSGGRVVLLHAGAPRMGIAE